MLQKLRDSDLKRLFFLFFFWGCLGFADPILAAVGDNDFERPRPPQTPEIFLGELISRKWQKPDPSDPYQEYYTGEEAHYILSAPQKIVDDAILNLALRPDTNSHNFVPRIFEERPDVPVHPRYTYDPRSPYWGLNFNDPISFLLYYGTLNRVDSENGSKVREKLFSPNVKKAILSRIFTNPEKPEAGLVENVTTSVKKGLNSTSSWASIDRVAIFAAADMDLLSSEQATELIIKLNMHTDPYEPANISFNHAPHTLTYSATINFGHDWNQSLSARVSAAVDRLHWKLPVADRIKANQKFMETIQQAAFSGPNFCTLYIKKMGPTLRQ